MSLNYVVQHKETFFEVFFTILDFERAHVAVPNAERLPLSKLFEHIELKKFKMYYLEIHFNGDCTVKKDHSL